MSSKFLAALEAGADPSIEAGEKGLTALQIAERCRELQSQQDVRASDEGYRNFDAVIELLRSR